MKAFKYLGGALAIANLVGAVVLASAGDLSGGLMMLAVAAFIGASLMDMD